jgi:hypothetical protein
MMKVKGGKMQANKQNQENNKDLNKNDLCKFRDKFRAYFEAREALIKKYAKPKSENAA